MSVERLRVGAILAGGAAGALARAAVAEALPHDAGAWPWETFSVNVLGTLLLAWVVERTAATSGWRLLVGTGFCGAFTTFSTFQVEAIAMARDGHAALGAGYVVASLAAGMAAALAVAVVARRRSVP
jgi:CrcB protein